jgi:hypothetical protein
VAVEMTTVAIEPLPAGSVGHGRSAVSWGAILAGAFVAASCSIVLLALGGGLEFASISPWPGRGVSSTAFTVNTAIWLIVVQWLSAALGGYIAGRLRTKWTGTHTHEVFFRDTAHGLIMWSVTAVFVALALASSASSVVGGGVHALASAGSAAGASLSHAGAPEAAASGPMPQGVPGWNGPGSGPAPALAYEIDKLFRPAAGAASGGATAGTGAASGTENDSEPRVEALYIAFHGIAARNVPEADRAYLAQLVEQQTGAPAPEAQHRVDEFVTATLNAETKARAAADTARKAAAEASIYTALSMLVGAFIASVAAALGGRLRDLHH